MNTQKPSVGRVVHYTLAEKDSPKGCGRIRPALITSVSGGNVDEASMQVYTEGGRDDLALVHMKFDVQRSDEPKPGFWHWPVFVASGRSHVFPTKTAEVPKGEMYIPPPAPPFTPELLSELDDKMRAAEGRGPRLREETPSYVAQGTVSTWDGKRETAENPFPMGMGSSAKREPHFVASPPPGFGAVEVSEAFEGQIPAGMPRQMGDPAIPPPAATKPSLGSAPDGLPFAESPKSEEPKP